MNNKKSYWQDKVAVVTGASSGIGAATARRLTREGLQVVLIARRQDRLNELATQINQEGGRAYTIPADLSKEDDRARVFERVCEQHTHADILVNNAGLGWYGYGADMPWSTALEMLQVNVDAVVQLSLLFLVKMRERDAGHIINVGSISGCLPSQGVALYGATKSFLDGFTTALYREMQGTRVHVSVVRAGPVITEFCEKAANKEGGFHVPTERLGVMPEVVADRIWSLLQHPRRVIYIPRLLGITPWVELCFGWLIDLLGPQLLRRQISKPPT